MPQTPVNLMIHSQIPLPIELAKVGLSNSANHLNKDGFLILLTDIHSLPTGLPLASTMDKQLADRHSDMVRREGFLARRRIARAVLALALGIPAEEIDIGEGSEGEPLLTSPAGAFHLSFAARGRLALIGIATQRMGVDLEIVAPDMLIPWNMLRTDERALLEATPTGDRARAFSTLWTAKEAVVKALGLGFRVPPEAIEIEGWVEGENVVLANPQELPAGDAPGLRQWHLKTCDNLVVAEVTGGLVVGAASFA